MENIGLHLLAESALKPLQSCKIQPKGEFEAAAARAKAEAEDAAPKPRPKHRVSD